MTIKITAITASVFAVLLYVLATIFPNDIFFSVISSNTAVGIGRLVIAIFLVYLAFKKNFRSIYGNYLCTGAAIILTAFGLVGFFDSSMTYSLINMFKPLDYVFMLEVGAIFALVAVSYEHRDTRLPRLSRPRNTQLRLFSPSFMSLFGFTTDRQRS